MQASLFNQPQTVMLPALADQAPCSLLYFPDIFSGQADSWLHDLLAETPWQQDTIRIAGKQLLIPRLQAWYGDFDSYYQYSGLSLKPTPWSELLLDIRQHVQQITEFSYNAALINLYRDGDDSVSWHADDEPELGQKPVIASLSLGQSRRFSLKPKQYGHCKPVHLELQHGSLLLMQAGVQKQWLHSVPKQPKIKAPRINLTFRNIKL